MSIDFIPFGGLGNRLRVMDSVKKLSLEIHSDATLYWFKKRELRSNYLDLFVSYKPFIKPPSLLPYIYKFILKHSYINKYTSLYRFLFNLYYDKIYFDENIHELSANLYELKNKKILIATCYNFYPINDISLPELQKDMLKMVTSYVDMHFLNKNIIGLHIRRTDHKSIIQETSLSKIKNQLKKILKKGSNNFFFLCTDDLEVKNEFLKEFGGNILTREIELSRQSDQGIKEALCDLLILSKCKTIIGNYKSSFVTIAAHLPPKSIKINI